MCFLRGGVLEKRMPLKRTHITFVIKFFFSSSFFFVVHNFIMYYYHCYCYYCVPSMNRRNISKDYVEPLGCVIIVTTAAARLFDSSCIFFLFRLFDGLCDAFISL